MRKHCHYKMSKVWSGLGAVGSRFSPCGLERLSAPRRLLNASSVQRNSQIKIAASCAATAKSTSKLVVVFGAPKQRFTLRLTCISLSTAYLTINGGGYGRFPAPCCEILLRLPKFLELPPICGYSKMKCPELPLLDFQDSFFIH